MEEFTQKQISVLAAFVEPDRFSIGQSNRELHLHDISPHYGTLPAGIIWPVTTDEVAGILFWCLKMMFQPRPGEPAPAPRATLCRPAVDWSWI